MANRFDNNLINFLENNNPYLNTEPFIPTGVMGPYAEAAMWRPKYPKEELASYGMKNIDSLSMEDTNNYQLNTTEIPAFNEDPNIPKVDGGKNNWLKNAFTSGSLNGAATAIGGMAGGLIGGGMSSGVGSAIGGLASVASAIPGPWGAIAGAGLKVVGGLADRTFGSKLNEQNIASVNSTINRLNNFTSDASNFDTLADTWGTTAFGTNFNRSYIGKDGWASNKVKNKAKDLRQQLKSANAFAERSLLDNADTITKNTLNNLEANYTAFGGQLNTGGADYSTGLSFFEEGGTHETNPYGGIPIGLDPEGKPNLVEQGEAKYGNYVFSDRIPVTKELKDKYKLRGDKDLTFAKAVKQISKNYVERPNDPISKNTLRDLMSDFAQAQESLKTITEPNYAAYGGNLFPDGGQAANGGFTFNPYKYIDGYNGGWYDSDGKYTSSYLNKVNSMGIADINNAFNQQYKYYMNEANKGTDRWKAIDAFYTANPQYRTDSTNLTEAALPLIRKLATDNNPGFMHQFFDNASPIKRQSRYYLRGTDANGNPTVKAMDVTPWEGYNEQGRLFSEVYPNLVSRGSQVRPINSNNTIYTDYYYDETQPEEVKPKSSTAPLDLGKSPEGLRYLPAVGFGIATLSDALGLTNKPDYSEAGMVEAASKHGYYKPVRWNPIGNQLAYNPFDRDYYTNKLNAASGATRRALANQGGGNSGRTIAGLLAADYNAQNQLGDLFRKAEEYNLDQRMKVEDFNRATNQANSQGMLQADMANQQAYSNMRDFGLKGIMAAAELRQKARLASEAAKSANLSGLFQTLGDIGYENKNMNMVRRLAETGAFGVLSEPMVRAYETKKAAAARTNKKNNKKKG